MRQTLLRRGLIAALGFAALLFATLGTQPATTATAADLFSNAGCTYGDYSCLYARNGINYTATYGYPTPYYPSYTNYPAFYGAYAYAPVYSYSYAYTPAFYGYGYGYPSYGYGPSNRFFTGVGCNIGNYTCAYSRR